MRSHSMTERIVDVFQWPILEIFYIILDFGGCQRKKWKRKSETKR